MRRRLWFCAPHVTQRKKGAPWVVHHLSHKWRKRALSRALFVTFALCTICHMREGKCSIPCTKCHFTPLDRSRVSCTVCHINSRGRAPCVTQGAIGERRGCTICHIKQLCEMHHLSHKRVLGDGVMHQMSHIRFPQCTFCHIKHGERQKHCTKCHICCQYPILQQRSICHITGDVPSNVNTPNVT